MLGKSNNFVDVSLVIRNDSGEIIRDLSNVYLQYSNNGSVLVEEGVGDSVKTA